jgi:RNA polymerase sigma-70 factor (ECF subfamily)
LFRRINCSGLASLWQAENNGKNMTTLDVNREPDMSQDLSFADLMARVRAGDQEAAALLYERFKNRVIGLARKHLAGMLRGKEDPDDVAQSVFKSFFLRQMDPEKGFRLENWDDLWNVLLIITLRKCGRRIERWWSQQRDVRHEVALQEMEAIARDPTPEEAVMLTETVQEVLERLHLRDRPILELALQGLGPEEIAAQVHRTERTVYRVLKRIREKLEELRGQMSVNS